MKKWISIKDREPEPYDTVLLFENGKDRQFWFGHFDCAANEFVYYFGTEQLSDKNITHWMPLPDFPKEQEK